MGIFAKTLKDRNEEIFNDWIQFPTQESNNSINFYGKRSGCMHVS